MRKSLKRRFKKQRGGFLFSESNNPTNSITTSYSSQPSGLDSVMNSIKTGFDSASQSVSNAYNSVTNPQSTYTYEDPNESWWNKTKRNVSGWFSGGSRKGKRRYNKKGGNPVGYPDLSLATDVNGIKVAEPTYWIKGGSSKRRVSNKGSKVSKKRRHRK